MPDGYAELHAEEAAYAQWAELAALKEEDDERVLKEALIRESEAGLDKKARIIFATFFFGRGKSISGSLFLMTYGVIQVKVAESVADKWNVIPQSAGSFYMGNMCAAWHRIHHLDREEAGTLCEAAGNVQIAVMLRTDVFREERARSMSTKPTPCGVFDLVNQVVAESLATDPLHFPDLATCIAE